LPVPVSSDPKTLEEPEDDDREMMARRRKKYDSIMEKGNRRSAPFQETEEPPPAVVKSEEIPQEDALIRAALEKTERLRRLKRLQVGQRERHKGADAVLRSIREMPVVEEGRDAVTFEFDPTREFTRALRARADLPKEEALSTEVVESEPADVKEEPVDDEKEEKERNDQEAFGSTANANTLGRGISGFLSHLRSTGEITKYGGKEELRGRSKDEKTYEDYKPLDLQKVVKIDRNKSNANAKDIEFANREIKLEYRDEFGRLLTRKEAFRQMCYQFHGYGSSKKNEERRLKHIRREREEGTRIGNTGASGGEGKGTLAALKATQKATQKAFVVHRT